MLREEKCFVFTVHQTQTKIKSLLHFYIYKDVACIEYILKSYFSIKSCVNMYSKQNLLCFNVVIANKNKKSSYIFSYCWFFNPIDIKLHEVYFFYFQTANKLFIGSFKDVVQRSKGYFAMLTLLISLLVFMCSKKVINSTLSNLYLLLFKGTKWPTWGNKWLACTW